MANHKPIKSPKWDTDPSTKIEIEEIKIPLKRMRVVTHDVATIAESMADVGLLHPIIVSGNKTLIAGWHRLEAAKKLGWTQITAVVRDVDDEEAKLIEIAENFKNDLTVWEQSVSIAEYEEIMRRRGERRREGRFNSASDAELKTTSQIAKERKISERSYYNRAKIGTQICGEAAQILNTLAEKKHEVANSTGQLNRLADIRDEQEQIAIVKRVADGKENDIDDAIKALVKDKQKQEILEQAQAVVARPPEFHHGDCLELLPTLLEDHTVKLLLTDPPYGMAFQSNHRTVTAAPDPIEGDETIEKALELLRQMLWRMLPKLAEDAHVLIFTSWRYEPLFREKIEKAGLEIKGSLVWVKDNHSSGDLEGSFAPKHERGIHAVKGRPTVSPRLADIFLQNRERDTTHPTQKPVSLLQQLIEFTTVEGELVVDPFAGVASTLLAAKQSKRNYLGIEINRGYHAEGSLRLL